jgi:hypothetical protein
LFLADMSLREALPPPSLCCPSSGALAPGRSSG